MPGYDTFRLWDDPRRGICLVLRYARSPYQTAVHTHPFVFVETIVCGRYRQTLYDLDGPRTGTGTPGPVPLCIRHERVGQVFALHRRMAHATAADRHTVSLLLCGPGGREAAERGHGRRIDAGDDAVATLRSLLTTREIA